jgi:hypothetical protein
MTGEQDRASYLELIWVISAVVIGFYFAFDFIDFSMESLNPELARFICGSILGITLGGSLAIAGIPLLHLYGVSRARQMKKGVYERTEPTNTADPR